MQNLDRAGIERALVLLAERLAFDDAPPTTLLVAGGSALTVLGLVAKTTKDVDVIALVTRIDAGLLKAKPLPRYLEEAAERVAGDIGLDKNWLNPGPADLLDWGLPEGCLGRSELREYGTHLGVYFISRYDQIHLKLYAAVDQGGGRHLVDLLALNPTREELRNAALWARTHDSSVGFRKSLISMLDQLGYGDLAHGL